MLFLINYIANQLSNHENIRNNERDQDDSNQSVSCPFQSITMWRIKKTKSFQIRYTVYTDNYINLIVSPHQAIHALEVTLPASNQIA